MILLAPGVGIEPTTNGLTVRRSTAELPGNVLGAWRRRIVRERGSASQGNAVTAWHQYGWVWELRWEAVGQRLASRFRFSRVLVRATE